MSTVKFRHRRYSKIARYAHSLLAFISAQTTRLSEASVKATGTLTASALATADTITLGSKTYTIQDTLVNADGNVKRSGTLATDLATLRKAINLTGVAGTDYAAAMTIHPTVEAPASAATTLSVRAKVAGTAGNAIASTETSTTAAFAVAHLTGGLGAAPFDPVTSLRHNTAEQILAATDKDTLVA